MTASRHGESSRGLSEAILLGPCPEDEIVRQRLRELVAEYSAAPGAGA